jgi:hypothetical protein
VIGAGAGIGLGADRAARAGRFRLGLCGSGPAILHSLGQRGPSDADPALAGFADEEADRRFDFFGRQLAEEIGEGGDLGRAGRGGGDPRRCVDDLGQEHVVILAAQRGRIVTVRFNRLVAALLPLAVILGACGGDDKDGDGTKVTTGSTTGGEKTDGTAVTLKAPLSGADEVPGPGADPGVGAALVDISGTKLCPNLKVTMGEKPTAAHIHQGAKGAAGPVFVDLKPEFTSGESAYESKKCVDITAEQSAALIASPEAYYLNIHSDAHPNGAVRGQLGKF